jgi:hypothetical protein
MIFFIIFSTIELKVLPLKLVEGPIKKREFRRIDEHGKILLIIVF